MRGLIWCFPCLLFTLATGGCKPVQFVPGGVEDGVEVSYRWNHRPEKPSELIVKMSNSGSSDKQVHLGLDLYHQGLTVEQFSTDTCIKAGRTLNGKLNGFYFIPQALTAEQLAGAATRIEVTRLDVEDVGNCP